MKWLMLEDWVAKLERFEDIEASDPQLYEAVVRKPVAIRKGVATISIKGPLLKQDSPFLAMFGIEHASYEAINAQVAEAISDGAKSITFDIDSPGGNVNGLYETMATIKNAGIPTQTIAGDTLASAAYMLASQTDKIVARNEAGLVGSIGVVTSGGGGGITNTDSPKKRPDASTEEGVRDIKAELDDMFQLFAERIADGRNTTVDNIKNNYGRGAVMTARTALGKNIIDGIMSSQPQTVESTTADTGDTMDLTTLKASHRDLYDAVVEIGRTAERDRVCAHLELAAESGDNELAHTAILEGQEVTATISARHMRAAMRKNQIDLRQEDDAPAIDATTPVESTPDVKAELEKGNPDWEVEVL